MPIVAVIIPYLFVIVSGVLPKNLIINFLEFYRVAAPHLKRHFPHIRIGGYASRGFTRKLVLEPQSVVIVDCP